MGRDRSEYKDKSAAEISLKLHEELNVSKQEAFNFWNTYQQYKADGIGIWKIMNYLDNEFDKHNMKYFAALAMEIISKEIIEGINVDKKES